MNKKGDINWVIVGFIILIISFGIILFFIYRLNLTELTNEQICYNSIVARSSPVIPTEVIPLNCKTNYICITKDGSCEMMTSPEIIEVQNADEVYSAIAEKMAKCWSTYGEGKLNYVGKDFTHNLYCSNCYQIGLDNSLNMFPNNELDKKELYTYMATNNVSGKDVSYLDYLLWLQSSQAIEDGLNSVNSDFGKISIGKQYYIVTGIFSDIAIWEHALGVGAGIALVSLTSVATGGVAIPFWIIIAGGTGGGYLSATITQGDSGQRFLTPTLVEANSEDYSNLKCESVNTLA